MLAVVVGAMVAGTAVLEATAAGMQLGFTELKIRDSGCALGQKANKPEVVGLAVVVDAGVSAPTKAPTKSPNSPTGAAVVAGTAVLDATAASTQIGFNRLVESNASQDSGCHS